MNEMYSHPPETSRIHGDRPQSVAAPKKLRIIEESLLKEWGLLNIVPLNGRTESVGNQKRTCYSAPSSLKNLPEITAGRCSTGDGKSMEGTAPSHKGRQYRNKPKTGGSTGWRSSGRGDESDTILEVVGSAKRSKIRQRRSIDHEPETDEATQNNAWGFDYGPTPDDDNVEMVDWPTRELNGYESNVDIQSPATSRTLPKCDVIDFSDNRVPQSRAETSTSRQLITNGGHKGFDEHGYTEMMFAPFKPAQEAHDVKARLTLGNAQIGEIPCRRTSSRTPLYTKPSTGHQHSADHFQISHRDSGKWNQSSDDRRFGLFKGDVCQPYSDHRHRERKKYNLAIVRSETMPTNSKYIAHTSLPFNNMRLLFNSLTASPDKAKSKLQLNSVRDSYDSASGNSDDSNYRTAHGNPHSVDQQQQCASRNKVTRKNAHTARISDERDPVFSKASDDGFVRRQGSSSYHMVDKKLTKMAKKKYSAKQQTLASPSQKTMFAQQDYVGYQHRKFRNNDNCHDHKFTDFDTKVKYLKVKIRDDE